jgi:RimJ/RimL family protein N-acetyltransferase
MSSVYVTDRLEIRPWTHDDVEVMFDIYRRWEVARWLGAVPKAAESVEAMHRTVDRWAARNTHAPFGVWAIVRPGIQASPGTAPLDTPPPVGTVLLVPLQDAAGRDVEEVEVGWHLHPDHWGHGYATEAAQGALDRAWAHALPAVHAVVRPGNTASVAVARRLGMSPLGRTSRWYGIEMDAFRVTRHQGP